MKIIHCADIHLGRRRLDGRLPEQDFADAFGHIVGVAIDEQADVFLLAGDLFDRPQVDPPHLRQAQEALSRLRRANIPVIAIEGNHDKAFLNSSEPTWVNYLADDHLLILLTTRFDATGAILVPWEKSTKTGSWLDLDGVRFVGAGYLGAATPHKVRQIVDRLEPGHTHVLLLHAGPDYFVGEAGGFGPEDLARIHEKVSYLALGHIHKPMMHGGWACNPGSPENCDLQEARYDRDRAGNRQPRGYAVVEIGRTAGAPLDALTIRSNPRRPCLHLGLDCTAFGNKLKDGSAAIAHAAANLIKGQGVSASAAVHLRLSGKIKLNRIPLDLENLGRDIERATGVLAVAVDASGINLGELACGAGPPEGGLTRAEIERASIQALVAEEGLWGLDDDQEAIANLFFDLKDSVSRHRSAEELAGQIRTSPLVEKVRLASLSHTEENTADQTSPAAGKEGSAC